MLLNFGNSGDFGNLSCGPTFSACGNLALQCTIIPGVGTMPQGYNVPYVAKDDVPYWLYKFGQGPKAANIAGMIPKGGLIHVQGPAGHMGGTHQSGYMMGVGRIIVRIGDFQPAPAVTTNS